MARGDEHAAAPLRPIYLGGPRRWNTQAPDPQRLTYWRRSGSLDKRSPLTNNGPIENVATLGASARVASPWSVTTGDAMTQPLGTGARERAATGAPRPTDFLERFISEEKYAPPAGQLAHCRARRPAAPVPPLRRERPARLLPHRRLSATATRPEQAPNRKPSAPARRRADDRTPRSRPYMDGGALARLPASSSPRRVSGSSAASTTSAQRSSARWRISGWATANRARRRSTLMDSAIARTRGLANAPDTPSSSTARISRTQLETKVAARPRTMLPKSSYAHPGIRVSLPGDPSAARPGPTAASKRCMRAVHRHVGDDQPDCALGPRQ